MLRAVIHLLLVHVGTAFADDSRSCAAGAFHTGQAFSGSEPYEVLKMRGDNAKKTCCDLCQRNITGCGAYFLKSTTASGQPAVKSVCHLYNLASAASLATVGCGSHSCATAVFPGTIKATPPPREATVAAAAAAAATLVRQGAEVPPHQLRCMNNLDLDSCTMPNVTEKGCSKRQYGSVCVYPDCVVKRVSNKHVWKQEMDMFELLVGHSKSNYFPKLLYTNWGCNIMVQENVLNRSAQHAWSGAAYEIYRTQLTHIFKIFNELQIHPRDINTCCNLITNGPEVKVIDFGLYFIEKNQSKLQQSNAHLLDKLLAEIARSVEKHAHRS